MGSQGKVDSKVAAAAEEIRGSTVSGGAGNRELGADEKAIKFRSGLVE